MTVLAKLVAREEDGLGYVIMVFECLDEEIRKETKYIMTTQYPNWNTRKIEIGEIGYLNFVEIRAGIDKWFDGKNFIPYNYNNIQFIKFIKKPIKKDKQYVLLMLYERKI